MVAPAPDPKHSQRSAQTRTTDQDPSATQPSDTQPAAAQATDPHLLEKVVQETLAAMGAGEAADSVDLQRLKSIAHRRRGQKLTLEPVVVEMVRALLGPNFAGLNKDPEVFLAMSTQVARLLMDDPVSCRRLEILWSRLSEK